MKHELLPLKGNYVEESIDEVHLRYSGFAKNIYPLLEKKLPEIYSKLQYFQERNYQMEDSYAIYPDPQRPFVIQLDPLCEVIVLWNDKIQIEIGTWSSDPELEAIDFILNNFIKQTD